jgi:hypothetical protein
MKFRFSRQMLFLKYDLVRRRMCEGPNNRQAVKCSYETIKNQTFEKSKCEI